MPEDLTDDQRDQILAAMKSGKKIDAVKLHMQATGSSLAIAKHYVDRLSVDGEFAEAGPEAAQIDEILDAIQAGRKLKAVKLYKDQTGKTLKESKDFVEDLMRELQIDDSSGRGCGTAVLLTLMLITGVGLSVITALVTLS